jgi:plastocyanin
MMNLFHYVICGGVFCAGAKIAFAGSSVEGTVALPKPATQTVTPSRYQNKTPGEVGPPEKPVAVVYLAGNFPASARTNASVSAKVLQEHVQFSPAVLPVRTGTSVDFPNLDDSYHNVFSYSKPKRFDLGRYRKEEKPAPVVFDKPGAVKLYCEIHEHMRGVVLVLDTPHFTRTDTNGTYRLENLPAGKFVLKAWLSESKVIERPVELRDGEMLKVDFADK